MNEVEPSAFDMKTAGLAGDKDEALIEELISFMKS